MLIYKSFTDLKALARNQMNGKLAVLIGAFLLQELFVLLTNSLAIALFPANNITNIILNYIISFIIQLIFGIFRAGACLLHLHIACNMPCQVSDLFYGFKHNPDKSIKIQFVFAIINVICMLPVDIALWMTPDTISAYDYLMFTSLLSLLSSVAYLLITLPLYPIFYLLLDFPNLTVMELLKKSLIVSKGNRIRFLLLQLSFFPIMILGVLTCGIALLWIIPYMNVTLTNYYLDIMACRNRQIQQ